MKFLQCGKIAWTNDMQAAIILRDGKAFREDMCMRGG